MFPTESSATLVFGLIIAIFFLAALRFFRKNSSEDLVIKILVGIIRENVNSTLSNLIPNLDKIPDEQEDAFIRETARHVYQALPDVFVVTVSNTPIRIPFKKLVPEYVFVEVVVEAFHEVEDTYDSLAEFLKKQYRNWREQGEPMPYEYVVREGV